MQPNNSHDILEKIQAINALLISHLQQTKKTLTALESTNYSRNGYAKIAGAQGINGVKQVVSQWQPQLN